MQQNENSKAEKQRRFRAEGRAVLNTLAVLRKGPVLYASQGTTGRSKNRWFGRTVLLRKRKSQHRKTKRLFAGKFLTKEHKCPDRRRQWFISAKERKSMGESTAALGCTQRQSFALSAVLHWESSFVQTFLKAALFPFEHCSAPTFGRKTQRQFLLLCGMGATQKALRGIVRGCNGGRIVRLFFGFGVEDQGV